MNIFRQNNSITALKPKADGLETLMFDLVLAVIIRLQMLHVKSIVGRTDSTQVQSMTDLEAEHISMLRFQVDLHHFCIFHINHCCVGDLP